ncbi:MAG: VanZ family protein [Coriobacteriales bacterium]|nr:VanZ family protein [Coriobacteriales bacterium]
MRSRALAWIAVLCWAAIIFFMSSKPGSQIPGRFGAVAHVVEYAVLAGLLVVALAGRARPGAVVALAVLAASVYGITDEIHQAFVPGRVSDVADWGLDTLGAVLGSILAIWALRLRLGRDARSATRGG